LNKIPHFYKKANIGDTAAGRYTAPFNNTNTENGENRKRLNTGLEDGKVFAYYLSTINPGYL